MRCSAGGAVMPPAGSSPRSENRAEENIVLRHIVESLWFIGAGNGTKSSAGAVVEKIFFDVSRLGMAGPLPHICAKSRH